MVIPVSITIIIPIATIIYIYLSSITTNYLSIPLIATTPPQVLSVNNNYLSHFPSKATHNEGFKYVLTH